MVAASSVLFALLAGMAGTTVGLIEAKNPVQKALAAADEERQPRVDAEEQKGNALRFAERKKADAVRVEAQAKEAEANGVVTFFAEQVFAAARSKGQDGGLGKHSGSTPRAGLAKEFPETHLALAGEFQDQGGSSQ